MSLNDAQQQRFNQLAQEMINFLSEVGDPHTTVIITQEGAELLQGYTGVVKEG